VDSEVAKVGPPDRKNTNLLTCRAETDRRIFRHRRTCVEFIGRGTQRNLDRSQAWL